MKICAVRIATASARYGFPIARTLGNCLSMANYSRLYTLLGPAKDADRRGKGPDPDVLHERRFPRRYGSLAEQREPLWQGK